MNDFSGRPPTVDRGVQPFSDAALSAISSLLLTNSQLKFHIVEEPIASLDLPVWKNQPTISVCPTTLVNVTELTEAAAVPVPPGS